MIYVHGLISVIFLILQSTVMHYIGIEDVVPDLAFVTLAYIAFYHGSFVGSLFGFSQGIVLDIIIASPPGFFSLCRTLIGFTIGKGRQAIQFNFFILPILIVSVSFLIKTVVELVISLIFGQTSVTNSIFNIHWLIEFGYTVATSWLVFLFLNFLNKILTRRRRF